jgi:hypothetical protein
MRTMRVDTRFMNFFDSHTDVGDCRVPREWARPHHRAMHNWQLIRVARPGEQAANEALPEQGSPRQVWITRLGAYTRVILIAETGAEAAPPISKQSWA